MKPNYCNTLSHLILILKKFTSPFILKIIGNMKDSELMFKKIIKSMPDWNLFMMKIEIY